MTTIWKFPIKIKDEQTIEMPGGSKILCVQTQGREQVVHPGETMSPPVCLWAVVDPKAASYPVKVFVH